MLIKSSPTDQNDIGVPYILMSKAPGIPLASFVWDDDECSADGNRRALTLPEKQKVMAQLGKIYARLSNLRLEQIGSLMQENDNYVVGKCLSPTFLWHGRDEFDEDDIPLGPFENAESFYKAQVFALLAHVRELPMEHHLLHAPVPMRCEYDTFSEYRIATDRWNDYVTVGSKIESSQNRVDYTLGALALLDLLPSLAKQEDPIECRGFPLYHPDLSTNNLFVDADLNVTCIIDWACTSSVSKSMLLICPGLPHSRDKLHPCLVHSFEEGFIEGKGGLDGQTVLPFDGSHNLWHFSRFVNLDSLQDYDHFWRLIQSLIPGKDPFTNAESLKNRAEFKNSSEIISRYDTSPEEVAQNEHQYFSCVGDERLAISRHLSVVAKLNPHFVADRRLWKWVATSIKERACFRQHRTTGNVNSVI